jgi:2-succinyl-5-enolpyruvyl-6-hydroxy-3-cyclohexene-1-carboxylate synthase
VSAIAEALRLPARRTPDRAQVAALGDAIRQARRGLIVCGEQRDPDFPAALAHLAAAARLPVLADPLSGVRCGTHVNGHVVDCYDALLRDAAFADAVAPDLVLRFGAAPTSKPLLQFLERHAGATQALVADGGWADPALVAGTAVEADPTLTCRLLASALESHAPDAAPATWATRWRDANGAARAALDAGVTALERPFEGRIFTELAALLPDGALLFAGNSMPVRDLDTFFPAGAQRLSFLANRGASGIDGVVSSALGAAAAHRGPTVLVIGDLSFYHDMNGLLAARRHALDLTIVLVNNDGGGIFSFLPQADQPAYFEPLFGTPHGLDFAPAAALYGARFSRPACWEEFRAAVREGLAAGGLHIVEVRTQREENVRQHRALWPRVAAAARELAWRS